MLCGCEKFYERRSVTILQNVGCLQQICSSVCLFSVSTVTTNLPSLFWLAQQKKPNNQFRRFNFDWFPCGRLYTCQIYRALKMANANKAGTHQSSPISKVRWSKMNSSLHPLDGKRCFVTYLRTVHIKTTNAAVILDGPRRRQWPEEKGWISIWKVSVNKLYHRAYRRQIHVPEQNRHK